MNKGNILFTVFIFGSLWAHAQSPAFYHLSTAEGLSDNNVYTVARDRNGIVWIGTGEGLNSFDGNRITTFYKNQHKELPENSIDKIVIDDDNNVWVRTNTPFVTMLDKKRKFHRFAVGDTADGTNVGTIFLTSKGVFATKNRKHYLLRKESPVAFEQIKTPFDSLLSGSGFTIHENNDTVIFYRSGTLTVAHYGSMKKIFSFHLPGLNGARNLDNNTLLAYDADNAIFYRISIAENKIIATYSNIRDQNGNPIAPTLRNSARIDENRIAFTNYFSGLYIIDFTAQKATHYFHDPINPRSIGGNNTMNIKYDTSGYLFVTTQTSGLHFYNIKQKQAFSRPYFMSDEREVFDGYIQSIVTDKEDNVWMGAQDRLIKWDRKTDKAAFIPIKLPDGTNISGRETIRVVDADSSGNLWVGTSRYGVYVFDKKLNIVSRLTDSAQGAKDGLPSVFINAFCQDSDNKLWVGTPRGLCIADKPNLKITSLKGHPVLGPLDKINCTTLWRDDNGDIWAGSYSGVWHYSKSNNKLVNYSIKEGLANNTIEAISKDNLGNYYFATQGGLSILSKDGKIFTYTRSNGLRNDRCEGLLKDEKGFMWIGNLNCIMRYDPAKKKFAVYEDGYGFSHGGFRMRCAYINDKGEMFWGTDKGLVSFFPEQMSSSPLPLRPFIHTLQADNNSFYFTEADKISFQYNTSSFLFHFSSGELSGDRKNQLLCKLSGFDKDWKQPSMTGQAVYSKLPPGNYTFMVKASKDGISWYEAAYPVTITVLRPWWQQTWFRVLCIAAALGMMAFVYSYFQRRRKNKMAMLLLNTKMAETKFLNLRLQMNPHFLFNSLSAIQHLIVSQQTNKAYKYLTVFSNFLRSLLNFAEKNFIRLDEELKILSMYTELESLRFDESFKWKITTDENLAGEEVFVPSLMVQPFAENAIWHGLLHKEGKKELSIHFSGESEEYLTCTIQDNGIGREKARQIKEANINSKIRQSRGIDIIKERLELLQQKTGKPAKVEIEDLYDTNHQQAGTRVKIIIPYYNPEET